VNAGIDAEGNARGTARCDLPSHGANEDDGKLEHTHQRGAKIQLLMNKHFQPRVMTLPIAFHPGPRG
jgi:hypothetical protein